MLWPSANLDEVYDNIKEQSLGAGCSVLIFVAMDCDALCSCQILTQLFRSDNIAYKVKPVNGTQDILQDYNLLLQGNDATRSVLMINCGGDINVATDFEVGENTFFYIIDSRRPYHHINVLGVTSNVIIFGDDEPETKIAEQISEYIADIDPKDVEEDSDSDSEEEEAEEEGEHEYEAKLETKEQDPTEAVSTSGENDSVVDDNRETDDEGNEDTDGESESKDSGAEDDHETRKRARSGASKASTTISVQKAKRQKFREYYKGTFFGQPASHTAHVLAEQLNKGSSGSLWLSIVGSTHHFLSGHLNNDKYNLFVLSYKTQLNSYSGSSGGEYKLDDGTIVPVARSSKIEYIPELRLMLHRHWSLYNALYFSDYVASKLGIWQTNGKSTLKTFLARMGISLKECNQKFSFMSVRLKNKLRDKITEHMEEFDLEDILYGSFQFQAGFDTLVSAADVTYGVQALLEQPKVDQGTNDENQDSNSGQEADPSKSNKISKAWLENFNEAYESLASHDHAVTLLKKGINVSMDLQKAVVSEAIAIMEGKLIQSAGDFRYCVLEKLSDLSELIFSQPQSLTRLAKLLVFMNQSAGKWQGAAQRPFLLGLKSTRTNKAYFVGLQCAQPHEMERNYFGRQFQTAAARIQTNFKHNGFESSSVEIDNEDVQQFLVALHEVMMTSD